MSKMKYICFILLAITFAGCKRTQGDIEITGTAPGVTYGNVIIRDLANNNVFRTDIEAGKFKFKEYLQYSGYYKMLYASKATKGSNREVELYLEPGTYTINIDQDRINDYPRVTSSSQMQTQLSAYYAINDTLVHQVRQKVVAINQQIQKMDDGNIRSSAETDKLSKMQAEELRTNQVDQLSVFTAFMVKFPDNEVAAHLMTHMDYQDDPVAFYRLFTRFSNAAKNSDEGQVLEGKLKELSKLAPGGTAPAIAGTTPDGKEVNIKAMNKKLILLDFWRSTNGTSRDNHEQIISQLLQLTPKGFDVVSVSFDTDKDKWLAAIDRDKMKWTQVSDLKGDDSPNGPSWGIKSIPAYYLVDGQGLIIERVVDFADVPAAVDNYFKHH
jgi:peroxiredoxin